MGIVHQDDRCINKLSTAGQQHVAPILSIQGVSKSFQRRGSAPLRAVHRVSVDIYPAETVALVGESGSGKTTLSRIALGLIESDEGEVLIRGRKLESLQGEERRRLRMCVQPVFQDSSAAFNPRKTVSKLLAQAISAAVTKCDDPRARAIQLLEQVRLLPATDYLDRFPHELSGGQRQRLAVARAIAPNPSLIVADEPLSGADVSTRGQILNLLLDVQQEHRIAYFFITHDIAVARAFADRIVVMYKGEIVEQGTAAEVIDKPKHDYTKLLVSSAAKFVNFGTERSISVGS